MRNSLSYYRQSIKRRYQPHLERAAMRQMHQAMHGASDLAVLQALELAWLAQGMIRPRLSPTERAQAWREANPVKAKEHNARPRSRAAYMRRRRQLQALA